MMNTQSLAHGFLFGVRVANNINGNTVDIEIKTILDALLGLASGNMTIQSTGAELKMQYPELDAEAFTRVHVSHDQNLAKLLLDHIQGDMTDNRGIPT